MVSPSRSSSRSRWALQTSTQQSWQHARRPSLPDTSDKIAVAKRSLSSQHVRSASWCRRRRSAPDQGRCRRRRRRGAGSVLGGRLYRICQMQVSVAEGNPSLQHVRSASRLRRRRSAPDRGPIPQAPVANPLLVVQPVDDSSPPAEAWAGPRI